jgi:hypothetical protein
MLMMSEEEMFQSMLNEAIENKSDTPPEDADEFTIYVDTNYNVHMLIKGEWQNVGLNVTPI